MEEVQRLGQRAALVLRSVEEQVLLNDLDGVRSALKAAGVEGTVKQLEGAAMEAYADMDPRKQTLAQQRLSDFNNALKYLDFMALTGDSVGVTKQYKKTCQSLQEFLKVIT